MGKLTRQELASALTTDLDGRVLKTGDSMTGDLSTTGKLTGNTFASTATPGTAPMTVASNTKVINLNADLLDGYNTSITAAANTIPVYNSSSQLVGDVTGNAASATKLATARSIGLSGDVTATGVNFDGSSGIIISTTLPNLVGLSAGNYTKISVNTKGQVTGGQLLSTSDIPNLDWSKITTGTPTTLSGYGITDAYSTSGGTISGTALIKPAANGTTTFQVQNASGSVVLDTDTTNTRVGIGTATPAYTLDVNGTINTNQSFRSYATTNQHNVTTYNYAPATNVTNYSLYSVSAQNLKTGAAIFLDMANVSVDKAWYYNGTAYTDETNNARTSYKTTTPFTVLTGTSDYFYLGDSAVFSRIYVDLSTAAVGLTLGVEYWNGTAWTTLTVTDGTSNLTVDGWLTWSNPADWATTTVSDATGRYYIRLKTTTAPSTSPSANYIDISQFTGNFLQANNANTAVAYIGAFGDFSGRTLNLSVANGTAPMTVSSSTKVANLNADQVDGYNTSTTAVASTIPVYNASAQLVGDITGNSATTTVLKTGRTIGLSGDVTATGVSFDGSANITLTTSIASATTSAEGIVQLNSATNSTSTTQAATPSAVKSAYDLANAALPKSGGTMTGAITLSGDPTQALHATTKQYVDNLAAGIDVRQSVKWATTADLGTVTYNNGTSGVGATLTLTTAIVAGDSRFDLPGSTSISVGDRVLVKNQGGVASHLQNGIYTVTSTTVLTRATDADGGGSGGQINPGMFMFVEQGTVNADTGWVLVTDGTITVGTTALGFTQFTGAGMVTAGTGLSKSGNTVNLVPATSTIIGGVAITAGNGFTYNSTTGVLAHDIAAGSKHIPSGGATGQFLGYSGTSGTASWSTPTLSGLSDTTITSAATANYLRYNGTKWVNANLSSSDITTALTYTPVNKAGDAMSGSLKLWGGQALFATATLGSFGLDMQNSDLIGINALIMNDSVNGTNEGIFFAKTGTSAGSTTLTDYDRMYLLDGVGYINSNTIYHSGNITAGTAAPTGGNNGDIYIQY